jgi:hypothetical protein
LHWPITDGWRLLQRPRRARLSFAGFRIPPADLGSGPLVPAVRLSCRDVEKLPAERGITADHVSVYRWAQRFTQESSRRPGRAGTSLAAGGWSARCIRRWREMGLPVPGRRPGSAGARTSSGTRARPRLPRGSPARLSLSLVSPSWCRCRSTPGRGAGRRPRAGRNGPAVGPGRGPHPRAPTGDRDDAPGPLPV